MLSLLLWVPGLLLDQYPPVQLHPATAFSTLADQVRDGLHSGDHLPARAQRLRGIFALLLLCLPLTGLVALLAAIPYTGILAELAVLYLAFGARTLRQLAVQVEQHLQANEIEAVRQALAQCSTQDVDTMDAEALSRLTIELILETALERLFGVIFWFLVAGAGGVALYWSVRQLDHRWGHGNLRFRYFGWATARLDDVLNWPAAQLTALSYLLVGRHPSRAWRCGWQQRHRWKSPKGAVLLATGGAALGLQLGGSTRYFACQVDRQPLGEGLLPQPVDIRRARWLIYRALGLWLGVIVTIVGLYYGLKPPVG